MYFNEIYLFVIYLFEIVWVIGLDFFNVCGVLVGFGNRYNNESFFVYLGFVEEISRNGFKYYCFIEYGKRVVDYFREYYCYYWCFL